MANSRRDLTKNSWLLDSGASTHITINQSFFSLYTPLEDHTIIGIGSQKADGYGVVKLQFTVNGKQSIVTL